MQNQLTITEAIIINDDIDKFLLEEVLQIVQNTDTLSLVSFWGSQMLKKDTSGQEFLKKILLSINALIKANALRRNYYKIKDILIEEIQKDPTIQGTSIDMLFDKVDAFILIEGYFSQIKTSLDLLAQSLKPIYGIEFHTFERKKNVSGQAIVNQLKNVSKELQSHTAALADLISKNGTSITKIVTHRDDTVHYGKLNKVQGFRYSVTKKEVIPPLILINDSESAYVHEYMDEVLKYIAEFVQESIITILSNLMPGMSVVRDKDGWGWNASLACTIQ